MSLTTATLSLLWGLAVAHLFVGWVARAAMRALVQSRLRFGLHAGARAAVVSGLLVAPAALHPACVVPAIGGFFLARTALVQWRLRHGG